MAAPCSSVQNPAEILVLIPTHVEKPCQMRTLTVACRKGVCDDRLQPDPERAAGRIIALRTSARIAEDRAAVFVVLSIGTNDPIEHGPAIDRHDELFEH